MFKLFFAVYFLKLLIVTAGVYRKHTVCNTDPTESVTGLEIGDVGVIQTKDYPELQDNVGRYCRVKVRACVRCHIELTVEHMVFRDCSRLFKTASVSSCSRYTYLSCEQLIIKIQMIQEPLSETIFLKMQPPKYTHLPIIAFMCMSVPKVAILPSGGYSMK